MTPHPKVIATTLTGAVAIIVAAIVRGAGDPATILAAILTVAQAAAGYLTPSLTPGTRATVETVSARLPQYVGDLEELVDDREAPGTPAEQITTAGAPGQEPPT